MSRTEQIKHSKRKMLGSHIDMQFLFVKYNIRECKIVLNRLTKNEYKIAQNNTWLMRYGFQDCYVKVTRFSSQDLKKYNTPSTVRKLHPSVATVRSHVLWLPTNPNYVKSPPKRITRTHSRTH